MDPVTLDMLKGDKSFQKVLKKQQKEMDTVKKRHNKERASMQKTHCTVVDKLLAVHDKERVVQEKQLEKAIKKKGLVSKTKEFCSSDILQPI